MKYTRPFLSLAAGFAAFTLAAAPVVPGEFTDPTSIKKAFKAEGDFETPVDFQHPYISMYYLEPTIEKGDKTKVSFFVTDFDHSAVRMGDDSHTFDVTLKCIAPDGRESVFLKKGVKSGDGAIEFDAPAEGEYNICLYAYDTAKKLESHRVWQTFRVVRRGYNVIPADRIYNVTDADLKKYGICNKGDHARKAFVPIEEVPKGTFWKTRLAMHRAAVANYATNNPAVPREGAPGYTVYVPTISNRVPVASWGMSYVVYDPGYDTNKVEQAALKNVEGLQKLLDEKAAAGFRKVVLLPGMYRMSHRKSLNMPSYMTLDLNGATLKQNGFTGDHSIIVTIDNVIDAHLVNGTLEGDYYEHDYENSPNNSEWPLGFEIKGETFYSSVENVRVKDITGYGGANGMGRRNGRISPFWRTFFKYEKGALNPEDGTVDPTRENLYTSEFKKVDKKETEVIQISRHLGYQGLCSRQPTVTCCWYDGEKRFLESETVFQYRVIPVPEKARFVRITIFEASLEAAEKTMMCVTQHYIPRNCTIKNCVFDHCRCVGYAASAMKNFLFEGNIFTRSGESAAKCAFDAEDGWDAMQDATFRRNVCRDNPVNNSLLTCAGHNFIFEENDCDIHFWPRTHSPCVRGNKLGKASFMCESRKVSGYGRFENNTYSRYLGVKRPQNVPKNSWDYAFHDFDMTGPAADDKFKLELTEAARVVNSRFAGRNAAIAKAVGCEFTDLLVKTLDSGAWTGVVMKGGKIDNTKMTNDFVKCVFDGVEFTNFRGGRQRFTDCVFNGCTIVGVTGADITFENCAFKRGQYWDGWWTKASKVHFKNCTFDVEGNRYMKLGAYGVGDMLFDGCTMSTTNKTGVIFCDIADWRASMPGDSVPGRITVRNSRFGDGFIHAVGCGYMLDRGEPPKGHPPTKKMSYSFEGVTMGKGAKELGKMPKKVN